MTNDIDKTSPHYKGDFGSIYEVNKKFPTGGVAGDFVVIEGWAHYWNADRASWCVNAERDSYWDELITNIIEKFKLVRGATYMGVASIDTVPAKVIGAKMYYFATVAGTYKNFGDLAVPQGINVLYSENGSSWVNTTLLEVAQELGVSTWKTVSQKALNDALALKANQSSVNEALAKKADKEEMDRLLGTKANTSDVNTKFTEEKKRVDAELAKKFDKESVVQEFGDSKDKVVSQFALPFREIESPEFLHCIVDAEDRFLFGIQLDGSIEWSKGIPAPIRAKLQEIISKCQQDKTDVLEAINSVKEELAELAASITALQKGKVDKEEGKSLIEDEVKECFRVIENEEFLKAIVDSDDNVLFGFRRDTGKPDYPLNEMYHIVQNEEFLWLIIDTVNHPLLGIQQDGTCWAAKAQWLDDIKAIKKALSSIDEILKNLQPKEYGKGLINIEIADSFFYISNDEYLIAVVDAKNRILAGIKYDAQPYFPNHEMYSVITNEEWLYAIIDAENKVLGGFHANDGHMFVGGIDISTFISDAIIDIADIKERTAHLSTIENNEYLSVETDAEGKVIGYIAPDGSHYFYKVKSETIPTEFEHIEDPEKRMEITTDRERKVMSYRDANGKKHEHSMEVTNLDVSNLNLQGNSVNNIQDALKANGFDVKTPVDWSDSSFIQISEPRLAIINVTNIDSMPTTKQDNKKAFLEFWDMQGNYFKKHAILNAQGNSSMGFVKKNVAIDLCNDEWVGDDTPKVRIGEWVPQDSFHMKAYYTDFFRGVGAVAYKLYDQIVRTRGNMYDRPWKKALVEMDKISFTTKSLGNSHVEDYSLLTDTGARCFPDGFPCAVYINGKFYGIFSFQLKKHRDNYHLDKSVAENIHLDGVINWDTLWNGTISWGEDDNGFEIRNPKNLYAIGGNKYDADIKQEEIAGNDEVNSWIEAGKLPDGTAISAKIKKNLQLTAKVKKYIQDFANAGKRIYDAMNTYESSSKTNEDLKTFKDIFETIYDVDNLIDYIIVSDILRNSDGFNKNWQWFTYNGVKWYVGLYDCDMSFGGSWTGRYIEEPYPVHINSSTKGPQGIIDNYYQTELNARYKELADIGILTAKNVFSFVKNWTMQIGMDFYKEEYKKWADSPCISDSIIRKDYWELVLDSNGSPETDTSETFNATISYNVGEEATFGLNARMGFFKFRCIKKTIALSKNTPHTVSLYSPIEEFRHCDSIYRVEKWIEKNFINTDKIYNYNR